MKKHPAMIVSLFISALAAAMFSPVIHADSRQILVTDAAELSNALRDAAAGDEIILREGIYKPDSESGLWKAFQATADGTSEQHIILRSEDPGHPATISGLTPESKCALYITGSYWEIRDLIIGTACKGIFLAKSEHSLISGCEVCNTGDEAIHIIDDSSYNLIENCYVHDTGLLTPKYGEGVYIGSAKNATDYGFACHYNTVRRCRFGPNIAADHVDIKEYTIGNVVEYCTFDGTGMKGENGGDSFVEIKGNDAIIRYNTGYRNECEKQLYGFDMNVQLEGWGQNNKIYDNTLYLDTDECYIAKGWKCYTEVFRNHTEPAGCTYSGNRVLEVTGYQLAGDANEDGSSDRTDITTLSAWLLTENVPHISFQNADLSGDGFLSAADLTLLKRKILLKDSNDKPCISVAFRKEGAGKWRMSDGLGTKTVTFLISAEPDTSLNMGWGYWNPNITNEETGENGKWVQLSLGTVIPDASGSAEITVELPEDATRTALEVYDYSDSAGKRDKDTVSLDAVYTE